MTDSLIQMNEDKFPTLVLQNHETEICLQKGLKTGTVSLVTILMGGGTPASHKRQGSEWKVDPTQEED